MRTGTLPPPPPPPLFRERQLQSTRYLLRYHADLAGPRSAWRRGEPAVLQSGIYRACMSCLSTRQENATLLQLIPESQAARATLASAWLLGTGGRLAGLRPIRNALQESSCTRNRMNRLWDKRTQRCPVRHLHGRWSTSDILGLTARDDVFSITHVDCAHCACMPKIPTRHFQWNRYRCISSKTVI